MYTFTTIDESMIEQTRERLLAGETCLHHTGHMPGVGGFAFDPDVAARIASLKGRSGDMGGIVLVPDLAVLPDLGVRLSARQRILLEQYWPGNLTVALSCSDPDLQHLAIDGHVAFRVPTGVALREWLAALGAPITSSSVNRHGQPPLQMLDAIPEDFAGWFDFAVLFDTEYMEDFAPSTLIRFDGDHLTVLREGGIPAEELQASWQAPLALFVCTGNICRSPIAEYYARRHFQSMGLNVRTASAGFLRTGIEASANSQLVLGEHGMDGGAHRSTQLSPTLIRSAWRIYVMEHRHRDGIVNLSPNAQHKVFVLGDAAGMPGDVEDPYMQSVEKYRRTYDLIKERIDAISQVMKKDLGEA